MPILSEATLIRLLGSIEAGNLVILCGAGLSIPSPSSLMSAVRVAEACYDKWLPTQALPAAMRGDIDMLAGHFHANGQFVSVFIRTLVPWNDLVGEPNEGHAAVADLLVSRAAAAALSGNFDPLIEQWAQRRKIAMRGALDGVQALLNSDWNPLLKFHGCFQQDLDGTLWTQAQLQEADVQRRVASCANWMNLALPNRDLLIVGFWTDWGYLNDVLAQAMTFNGINSVTVVDLAPTADLQTKAPGLWAKLNSTTAPFEHVQASGADVLKELRIEFSKVWARKFFLLGKPLIEGEGGQYPAAIETIGWECEDVYNLRRDAEGTPYNRAAHTKQPGPEAAQAALAHLLLTQANATRRGPWYEHGGRSIRVVQGGGQGVSTVRDRYKEPPAATQPDIIICAGATDLGVHGNVIPAGQGASIVRPAPGGGAQWLTLEQARTELAI